ncbi:MAG: hypothetical protein ACI4MI_00470, partial [Christensenellales bacterium]
CVIEINDKEIKITENQAKTIKTTKPTASIFTYYLKQPNGEYIRSREKVIGNTVYTVISRERTDADNTAFDITKRIIERNIDEALKPTVRLSHKSSFESCNSGGNKQ